MNADAIEALWQKILTAALLGTARQPFVPLEAEGALGALLKWRDQADAEGALLSAAAAISYVRRAGELPFAPLGRALPAPCPPDPQPAMPYEAAELLSKFSPHRPYLLEEWLKLAHERRLRVPEPLAPELLAMSERIAPALGALIAGVRGRWLAMQLGTWQYAAFQLDDETAWRTGAPITRKTFLSALRLTEPERALRLLEATWEREAPNRRANLLAALAHNLDQADLPFLSRVAQTDRAPDVRESAARLIDQLQNAPTPEQREAEALPLFQLRRPWLPSEYALLARCEHAWSLEFSLRFTEHMPRLLAQHIEPNAALWLDDSFPKQFESFLARLHPEALESALTQLALIAGKGMVARYIANWQAMLRLRAAMHNAFYVHGA